MQEIWKDIKNYEGYYQVSNLGNVKSLSRKIGNKYYKSKMLKKSDNRGYLQVQLWKHSNMKGHFGKTHVRALKVNQFDKNGNFIKTWDSIIEASKKVGIPACCITNCAKLRRKSAGNFIWEYVN